MDPITQGIICHCAMLMVKPRSPKKLSKVCITGFTSLPLATPIINLFVYRTTHIVFSPPISIRASSSPSSIQLTSNGENITSLVRIP